VRGGDGDAGVRVVDIRPPAAYARGHIPSSENVPFPRLVGSVERFAGAERVVTVCPHGKSSVRAADLIASYEDLEADATVGSLAGGLTAWEGELVASADGGVGAASDGPDAPF